MQLAADRPFDKLRTGSQQAASGTLVADSCKLKGEVVKTV
jgi:hypothetical protein